MNRDVQERLLEGLKEAMSAERSGIEFFNVAASRTNDPRGKPVSEICRISTYNLSGRNAYTPSRL